MKRLLLCFLFLTITNTCFGDQYLCIAKQSTGFSFNENSGQWEPTNFNVDEKKYVISKIGKDETYSIVKKAYKVVRSGKDRPSFLCEVEFNKHGFIQCESLSGSFRFSNKNGRYLITYTFGYYNVVPEINKRTDKDSRNPFLEIGTCSPF